MISNTRHFYEFGPFRLDPDHRQLLRENQPVPLQPKAFDILLALVENSEKVVLKDDLMKMVWPGTFVEEANLAQNISVLRKTLGEAAGENRYIVTLPGRGYRFAQSVNILRPEEELVVESHTRSHVVIEELDLRPPRLALPSSPRRARRNIAIAVLAGLIVAGYFAWRHYASHSANTGRVMLAVLPFQNLTGDPDQEYFADGLTEEMITKLGRLHPEQLGVIGRIRAGLLPPKMALIELPSTIASDQSICPLRASQSSRTK